MSSAVLELQQLGFTQYEAQAYVSLVSLSSANGYELAKASGIPRPNIYPILQKLEERGAVLRIDGPEGKRYAPLPPSELLSRLKQQVNQTIEAASGALQEIAAPASLAPILNTRGYPVLLEHAAALLDAAQHHLLISAWPEETTALAEPLHRAQERGVQITTLCLAGCPRPCLGCQGELFRYPIAPSGQSRWFVLVQDDAELVAAEISPHNDTLSVRTCQKMLVNLAASYIQNSIALASILAEMGKQPQAELSPQTQAALRALHPLQGEGSWLEVMCQLIHSKEYGHDSQ